MLTLGKASALFGLIACGAAILYFTFQLYFDWMDHHSHMSSIKTAIWTVLHLPYHIAVVLTVEGCGQWITWRRTMEAIQDAIISLLEGVNKGMTAGKGGQGVVDALDDALSKAYKTYTFSAKTVITMGQELEKIAALPDSYWESFDGDRYSTNPTANDTVFSKAYSTLEGSLINGIFGTYGLTTSSKAKTQAEAAGKNDASRGEDVAMNAVGDRLVMIVSCVPVPPLTEPNTHIETEADLDSLACSRLRRWRRCPVAPVPHAPHAEAQGLVRLPIYPPWPSHHLRCRPLPHCDCLHQR